jgi:hypothetical protein
MPLPLISAIGQGRPLLAQVKPRISFKMHGLKQTRLRDILGMIIILFASQMK